MKINQKRIVSIFLAILMLFSVLPAGTVTVRAAVTLSSLQNKYPSGKYWNGGNADSYTSIPCSHHTGSCPYNGSCGCNTFKNHCIQCMGFAYKLASLIYGGDPYTDWKDISRNASSVDSLKAGDIVCYKNGGHYIFVCAVNGDIVTYADCNSSGTCNIRWGQTITKSQIKATFSSVDRAPSAWSNGSSGTHTCAYSGSYFESAHPHRVYQKCSCGKTKYTGATKAYSNCSSCMKLSTAYVMPIKAYTINTGKTTVYSSVNGTAKSNKIYDTDLCTISQIYDCGWCKVSFPLDSGGTETGYCKISVFMKGGGYIAYTSKQTNTYRRSDLKTSNGYAGAGDKIYMLGTAGSAVQIAYPMNSSTWKVGWVPQSAIKATVSYNANGGNGSMVSSSVQYNGAITLAANKFTKPGYTFSGWNVYRASDKKWYVSGQGWKTASEISKNKYAKTLYKNQFSGTLGQPWLNLGKTNDTFTFYAVWTPNKLSVNYNVNGGIIRSDTYKLSNNIVYKKSNNAKLTQIWTYNNSKTDGLYNASTFGLTREGYTFKGWGTTASGGTVFDQNDGTLVPTSINSAIKNGSCSSTLYAIWTPKTYSVKFDSNGGSGTPSSQTKTYGKNLVLSSTKPTREGYEFLGWATSKTASGVTYQPGSVYTANSAAVLYAVWNPIKLDSPSLKVTVISNCSFTLSWNAVSGANRYEIYLKNTDGSYRLLRTVATNSTTIGGAVYGKVYTYKVRALNSNNASIISDYSSAVSAVNNIRLQTPVPKAVINKNASITISWNAIMGADKYEIYLKNADGSYRFLKTSTANSVTIGGAIYGKTYTYRVRALNSKNSTIVSAFSSEISCVNNKKLLVPQPTLKVNANASFTLSWNPVAGANIYEVYLKNVNGSYRLLKTVTSNSATIGGAVKNKTYTYRIRAINSNNSNINSGFSCEIDGVYV